MMMMFSTIMKLMAMMCIVPPGGARWRQSSETRRLQVWRCSYFCPAGHISCIFLILFFLACFDFQNIAQFCFTWLTSLAIFFVNIAIIFSKLKPPWQLQLHNCSELKPPWRPFSQRSASRTCRRRRSVARSSFNMMLYIIIVIIGDKYNDLSKPDLASERAPLRRTDRSEQSWNCGEARRSPGLN